MRLKPCIVYDIGHICEPDAPLESVVMANALVNSAPLIAGRTDPEDRRQLAQYVYRIARGLIGTPTAKQLNFPSQSTFGAITGFKLQQRYGKFLSKLFPERMKDNNFARFTGLLESSTFDREGIRYSLPDKVYSEESTKW